MGERYHVATCSGYLTDRVSAFFSQPGLSAYVIDRLDASRVVKTFRSEDPLRRKHWRDRPGKGKRLGRHGAVAAAIELADELNADDA